MSSDGEEKKAVNPSALVPGLNEKVQAVKNLRKQFDISQEALTHSVEVMNEMKQQVDESYGLLKQELNTLANIPVADLEKLKAFGAQPYALLPRKHKKLVNWAIFSQS